jgi:eukaryotic-like serine/threonine-protein kinase
VNPGETIGHYKVIEPLGKGGMGEVFVAEDTRLNRRVALKILPRLFAADPEYRERFQHEARAIAALNHPGIVTIHSVEEDGGRLFLTMELVDGGPLSETIPKGGLPLEKLLRIGIEVADAMAAAQQRGITHRDLKPGNIMITPAGRAKVLDFGLAKVHDQTIAGKSDDVTRMSSSSDITGEGKIIGTVAYMSPEQAEGKAVDPRSDIFSLGVVLHEMATGDRPFKGDTNVSVLSAILKDTPVPVTDSNPSLPADLARIVRRCLAKDPERRYQTAADLRNELEELKQDTASGTAAMVRPGRRSLGEGGPTARGRWPWGPVVAGIAAVAVTIGIFQLIGRRPAPAAAVTGASFSIDRLQRLTTTGTAFLAAISPDGRYVVHVKLEESGAGLWTRQTATPSDVRIVSPADVRFDGVAFTPDANYVYYSYYPTTGTGTSFASLYKVPVLGGTPTKVLDDIDSPVTFSPNQQQLAFTRGSIERGTHDLMVANVDGSGVRSLAQSPSPDRFQAEGASWSPDGRTILVPANSPMGGVIYAVDATSGAATKVGQPWGFLRDVQWLPGGAAFLATGVDFSGMATPQIWQVAYPSGERSRVTNDLNAYVGASVSADGRSLATVQNATVAGVYVVDKPGAEPRRVTGGAGLADGTSGLAFTPDDRIVYSSSASGLPQLWIVDSDGRNGRQLTSLKGPAQFPSVAPDGKWIYFTSFAKEGICLFRIAPDGSGLQQLTTDGDSRNPVVSRDGKTLYFTATKSGKPRPMRVPAEGGTPVPLREVYFRVQDISPDGTRLMGVSWNETERRVVLAQYSLKDDSLQLLPGFPVNTLFTPDGGLAGTQRIQGKNVIGRWPPGGGTFKAAAAPMLGNLYGGAVSSTGHFAISRGESTNDVVLITAKQETK